MNTPKHPEMQKSHLSKYQVFTNKFEKGRKRWKMLKALIMLSTGDTETKLNKILYPDKGANIPELTMMSEVPTLDLEKNHPSDVVYMVPQSSCALSSDNSMPTSTTSAIFPTNGSVSIELSSTASTRTKLRVEAPRVKYTKHERKTLLKQLKILDIFQTELEKLEKQNNDIIPTFSTNT